MLPSVGRAIGAVDPALSFVALETRPLFPERSLPLAVVRTGAWIFASFGLGALILASVDIYGVESLPGVAAHAGNRHPHRPRGRAAARRRHGRR